MITPPSLQAADVDQAQPVIGPRLARWLFFFLEAKICDVREIAWLFDLSPAQTDELRGWMG